MGILNITPDSFSQDGLMSKGRKIDTIRNVARAQKLIHEGADMIDVGGESTRPGAAHVPEAEELRRVIPTIRLLARTVRVPVSIDTYKTRVAQEALEAGASIVNNIFGVKRNKSLLRMIVRYDAAMVLMHSRRVPRTMQQNIHYKNLIPDIIHELNQAIENCLDIGMKMDKIIIDPGIGFGKTTSHNLEIIARLKEFRSLGRPLLMGVSRKSFIGNVSGLPVHQRLMGTAAACAICVVHGAHFLRVHDVALMRQVADIADAIVNA
jgi:dihydropteroate synthase